MHVVKFCEAGHFASPFSHLYLAEPRHLLQLYSPRPPSTSISNRLSPGPRSGDGVLGALTRMLFPWPSGRLQTRLDLHQIRSNARERLEILYNLLFLHAMELFSYYSIEIQKEAEA